MRALGAAIVSCLAAVAAQDPESDYDRYARRVVPRDAFPVFDHPTLAGAEAARRGTCATTNA